LLKNKKKTLLVSSGGCLDPLAMAGYANPGAYSNAAAAYAAQLNAAQALQGGSSLWQLKIFNKIIKNEFLIKKCKIN
jgi:hypothetical protein